MHPLICKIGPFPVYSYGMMMALAVLICSFLLARDARNIGLSDEWVWDFVFSIMLGGIVGARLLFGWLNFRYFLDDPLEIFMLQHGGLSFQGGLLGGALGGMVFVKKKKLSYLKTADLLAPYLALGHAIGRIGCFLNGCCYGKHWDHGIFFPVHQDTLHPTQLYASAGL
ncbi:MAG: prolipoprotein diacylglyceryl transferase, partial [Candidatus Omnitrophica bacterium]|nr:prolipoprotein diacylglyceryl transferase [Candidatus Omnitrophota bacterium]